MTLTEDIDPAQHFTTARPLLQHGEPMGVGHDYPHRRRSSSRLGAYPRST
jgi:hypothetical protein